MNYLIAFEMPEGSAVMGVKINRLLKEIGAEKIHNALWRSDNLGELTRISVWVRNAGGSANILEERIVF